MHKSLLVFLLTLALVSCSSANPSLPPSPIEPVITSQPTATAPATFTPIPPSPTATSTYTPSPEPSATHTPENTPTPTATPLPYSNQAIDVNNAAQLALVGSWGKGAIQEFNFYEEIQRISIKSVTGLYIYDTSHSLIYSESDADLYRFSPSKKMLAVILPGAKIQLIDPLDGSLKYEFEFAAVQSAMKAELPIQPDEPEALSLAFSQDEKTLAVAYADTRVAVWDLSNGSLAYLLEDKVAPLTEGLYFSPTGDYLLGEGEYDSLWYLPDQKLMRANNWGNIPDNPFSPDGAMFTSGGGGGRIIVRSIPYGEIYQTLITGLEYAVGSFSQDGRYVLVNGGEQIRRLSDSRMVTAEQSGVTLPELGEPSFGWSQFAQDGHISGAHGFFLGETGSIYVYGISLTDLTGATPGLFVWSVFNGEYTTYPLPGIPLDRSTISATGKMLAVCTDAGLVLLDLATQEMQTTGHCRTPGVLSFSPDDTLLARGSNALVDVLSLPGAELRNNLYGHNLPGTALTFSQDGRYLASATDSPYSQVLYGSKIILWRLDPVSILYQIDDLQGQMLAFSFSNSGEYLAASDQNLRLWRTGDAWQENIINTSAFTLSFSPDDSLLAGINGSGEVILWSIPKLDELAALNAITGGARPEPEYMWVENMEGELIMLPVYPRSEDRARGIEIQFTPDGANLITLTADGILSLWAVR